MKELDLLFDRRSIRAFTHRKLEIDQLELILKAGMYAPSAVNRQPWHFIVLQQRDILERVMEIHPHAGMLKTASHALVALGYPDQRKERPERYHPVKVKLDHWDNPFHG